MNSDFVKFVRDNMPYGCDCDIGSNRAYMVLLPGTRTRCYMYYMSNHDGFYFALVDLLESNEFKFNMGSTNADIVISDPEAVYDHMVRYLSWLSDNCDYDRFRASLYKNFDSMLKIFANYIDTHEAGDNFAISRSVV